MTDAEYAELESELAESLSFATLRLIARCADRIIAAKRAQEGDGSVPDPPAEPE